MTTSSESSRSISGTSAPPSRRSDLVVAARPTAAGRSAAGPSSASISTITPFELGSSSTMNTPVIMSEPPTSSRQVTESMPAMMPAMAANTLSKPSRMAAWVDVV